MGFSVTTESFSLCFRFHGQFTRELAFQTVLFTQRIINLNCFVYLLFKQTVNKHDMDHPVSTESMFSIFILLTYATIIFFFCLRVLLNHITLAYVSSQFYEFKPGLYSHKW